MVFFIRDINDIDFCDDEKVKGCGVYYSFRIQFICFEFVFNDFNN